MRIVAYVAAALVISCAEPDRKPPVLASAPASALGVAALIARVGPVEQTPREMPRGLTVVGIAVRVTPPCPPCRGPAPCSPCRSDSAMTGLADAPGGPVLPVYVGMAARNEMRVGLRYAIAGQVDPRPVDGRYQGWIFTASEVWQLAP